MSRVDYNAIGEHGGGERGGDVAAEAAESAAADALVVAMLVLHSLLVSASPVTMRRAAAALDEAFADARTRGVHAELEALFGQQHRELALQMTREDRALAAEIHRRVSLPTQKL